MNTNLVHASIPAAELKAATDAIELAISKLAPFLEESVSQEFLDTMQKMGERSEVFTRKCLEYAQKDEELIPRLSKVEEAQQDLVFYDQLKPLETILLQITRLVQVNRVVAGSEALDFANDFYKNVRFLNQNNLAKAKPVYEDLKARYAKAARRKIQVEGN